MKLFKYIYIYFLTINVYHNLVKMTSQDISKVTTSTGRISFKSSENSPVFPHGVLSTRASVMRQNDVAVTRSPGGEFYSP